MVWALPEVVSLPPLLPSPPLPSPALPWGREPGRKGPRGEASGGGAAPRTRLVSAPRNPATATASPEEVPSKSCFCPSGLPAGWGRGTSSRPKRKPLAWPHRWPAPRWSPSAVPPPPPLAALTAHARSHVAASGFSRAEPLSAATPPPRELPLPSLSGGRGTAHGGGEGV